MLSERRKWNLRDDGWSWKDAASVEPNPEFQKRCATVVDGLQEFIDPTNFGQFLAADSAAAAFIRKQLVQRYEDAHRRIATFNARTAVERADPEIRESVRIGGAFPPDDVLDRALNYKSFCNREFLKDMELLDRLWRHAEEQTSDVSRRPAQRAVGSEPDWTSAAG
jgi:hypothetical protein